MKNLLRYYLCFWILICYASCAKLEQLFTFTITNESSVTIPATGPVDFPIGISSPDVTTNSSEAFANNNTDANHVKDVYLKSMELTITSPQGQTFNFLKSVHIYISTNSSNEIQLAYLDSIPQNVDSIALIPASTALDQYVKAPSYNLRVEAVISQGLAQDVSINITSKFNVTANL
jgi:hypothetical protein